MGNHSLLTFTNLAMPVNYKWPGFINSVSKLQPLHFHKLCQIPKLRKVQVYKPRRVSKLEHVHVHKFGQVSKPDWVFSESLNCVAT